MKQIKERNLNKNNQTPLHFAAEYARSYGKKQMEQLLVSKQAQ